MHRRKIHAAFVASLLALLTLSAAGSAKAFTFSEEALAKRELRRVLGSFNYVFAGAGSLAGEIRQDGKTSREAFSPGYTLGLDFDSLFKNPFTLELTYRGSRHPVVSGETAMVLYLELPIPKRFPPPRFANTRGLKNALDLWRDEEGRKELLSVLNGWTRFKVGAGIGYGGIDFEQREGRQYINGHPAGAHSTGNISGMMYAARIGYYGFSTMVRLTGYFVETKRALSGTVIEDDFWPEELSNLLEGGKRGELALDGRTRGRYIEAKLDIYHRLDRRILLEKFITGFGVSFIYREGVIREAEAQTLSDPFTREVLSFRFPEIKFRQAMVLVTFGYMR